LRFGIVHWQYRMLNWFSQYRWLGWIGENAVLFGLAAGTAHIAQYRDWVAYWWWGLLCCFVAVFVQYVVISLLVEGAAEWIYSDVPYYNATKRPSYSVSRRAASYCGFAARWSLPTAGYYLLWVPTFSPHQFECSLFNLGILAAKVEISLIAADIFYFAWHFLQHKIALIYHVSGHGFHHKHYYPIAAAGTWLSIVDLWISTILIGSRNIAVAAFLLGPLSEFEFCLCLGFVHEMNCCDHCGKALPFYSGFPLCPPLGYFLGFHRSIPMHEAHHNFNAHSFGLLGVADRLVGTATYATI